MTSTSNEEDSRPEIVKLAKQFKGDKNYFWTASPYGNSSQNSCLASLVELGAATGTGGYRSSDRYALCW